MSAIESASGSYRLEWGELVIFISEHNGHLLDRAENQGSQFIYPVSDTILVDILHENDAFTGYKRTLVRNKQGKVFQIFFEQSNSRAFVFWKEDSLTQHAMDLLNAGNKLKSLSAFQMAYEQNPEHYYLANFIRHFEFIQSPEFEKLKPEFTQYIGKYGDRSIYMESNQFFYQDKWGDIFQLLPLSEGKFMKPSAYNTQLHILNEKDTVSGLKLVYLDGGEVFRARSN